MKVILPHQISLGRMTVLMTMVLSVKCTGMLENTVLSKRYQKGEFHFSQHRCRPVIHHFHDI